MTEIQLDAIESAVTFSLPSEYRQVAIKQPFRPIGRDWVYWFYDDPARVIDGTLAPLADGEYDRAEWRSGLLTIGESASGDLYVMDTTAPGLPVHCLSHESHVLEPEYPKFSAFVKEWLKAPDAFEAGLIEERAVASVELQRRMRRAFVFMMCAVPIALVLAGLVSWAAIVALGITGH